eukprot:s104_g34.t1
MTPLRFSSPPDGASCQAVWRVSFQGKLVTLQEPQALMMGCGQSGANAPQEPQVQRDSAKQSQVEPNQIDLKIAELQRCKLQIGERSEVECHEPQEDLPNFDSWTHQLDSTDMNALKSGHSVPFNQWAHHQKAKKTAKSLVELVEDPSALKRAINMRRMDLEEVISYKAASGLNSIPFDKRHFEGPSRKTKPRKPCMEML